MISFCYIGLLWCRCESIFIIKVTPDRKSKLWCAAVAFLFLLLMPLSWRQMRSFPQMNSGIEMIWWAMGGRQYTKFHLELGKMFWMVLPGHQNSIISIEGKGIMWWLGTECGDAHYVSQQMRLVGALSKECLLLNMHVITNWGTCGVYYWAESIFRQGQNPCSFSMNK